MRRLLINSSLTVLCASLIGLSPSLIENVLLTFLSLSLAAILLWLRVSKVLFRSTLLTNMAFCVSIVLFNYAFTLREGIGVLIALLVSFSYTYLAMLKDAKIRSEIVKQVMKRVDELIKVKSEDLTYT